MENKITRLMSEEDIATIVSEQINYGGGGGSNMEARIAKLESDVGHIQTDIADIKTDTHEIKKDARSDFRLIFAAIIFTALGIAGLMAKGFGWL